MITAGNWWGLSAHGLWSVIDTIELNNEPFEESPPGWSKSIA